jgi:proteasome lid subunit RPN8/RPN11
VRIRFSWPRRSRASLETGEFGVWSVPGLSTEVRYSEAELRRIVDRAVGSYLEFPYGGREVGGVLFGKRAGDVVKVLASRPIECEHASGRRFLLSIADEKGLQQLLSESTSAPELKDLIAVGWYQSRTAGDLSLSADAVTIHERFFPEPWQVALVIRPEAGRPTRASFFVREAGQPMRPDSPPREFEAGPAMEAPAAEPPPRATAPKTPPAPPSALLDLPSPQQPSRWKPVALGVAALALAGAAMILAIVQWSGARPAAPLYTGVSLRLIERGGRLQVSWDPRAEPVREASQAVIEVLDGEARVVYPVEPAVLRQGSWSTIRASNHVRLRFQLETPGGPVEELTRFVSFGQAALAENRERLQQLTSLREELQKLQEDNRKTGTRYREMAAAAERRSTTASAPAGAAPREGPTQFLPPKPRESAIETLTAALPAAPQPPPLAAGLPLAQVAIPQDTAPARPPDVFPPKPPPVVAPPPAPKPQAQPEAETAKPAYGGPASGRVIWIGSLPANTTLTIEGRRASTGHVNAQLPGVPVRIGASPAEMSSGGFTVYSSAQKYARGVVEPPNSANGWNRTTFRHDVRRAADVVVIEPPSAANAWNRVALRSGPRGVTAIVLEWEVSP